MRRDIEYLQDILDSAKLAISYVTEKTLLEFASDIQCQDSVIRRIEIIGEAANRVSNRTQADLPSLDWSGMIGMRNIMIHQYQNVDIRIVWKTVQHSLPKLVTTLEDYL